MTNETKVWFVRHAEPDFSIREDALRPLTARGREDALKVASVLAGHPVDRILSSPLPRAMDTVRPLAEARGVDIELDEDFREREVGCWVEDFDGYACRQWADFDFALSGGESLRQVQRRNLKALDRLLKGGEGGSFVIGTHGTALSTILAHHLGGFGIEGFLRIRDEMPYVVLLRFQDDICTGCSEITGLRGRP